MDGGAWWAAVHGVAKSQTWLSDFTFTFHFHALEKEMATHSSVLAWRIPGMGEPGELPFMGSHRVRYDWNDAAAATLKWIMSLECTAAQTTVGFRHRQCDSPLIPAWASSGFPELSLPHSSHRDDDATERLFWGHVVKAFQAAALAADCCC